MPAGPVGGAWRGTYSVPVLLGLPAGKAEPTFASAAQVQTRLFGPAAFPVTLTTYYQEQSHNLMTVTGQTYGWFTLPHDTAYYTGSGGCGGGVVCSDATAHLRDFVINLLTAADASVDFSQFDNDGPDGIPNSGDDDGVVDLVAIIHPQIGGECQPGSLPGNPPSGNRHIWSHRYNLNNLNGGPFVTNDPKFGGGFIRINNYFLTGAEGTGNFGCTPNGIMQAATFAHEFGHGLGLLDLYDNGPSGFGPTEGLGHWDLMSSGNFNLASSPSFMSAFNRGELGWTTEVTLSASGADTLSPTEQGDTVFLVPTSTSGEYFLLENRDSIESDSFVHGPGLTVYHIDRTLYNQRAPFNTVNFGSIHAINLLEADGLRQLWCEANGCNRGDAGDPYPGTSGNTSLSALTNPSNRQNNGTGSGFRLDTIFSLSARGPVRFRIQFGGESKIAASDTSVMILVDAVGYRVFRDILLTGSSHNVSVADTTYTAGNRIRFTFASWSDGLGRTHTITGNVAGVTLTANLLKAFKLIATATPGGTITYSPPADSSGAYVADGTPVQLTANGASFVGWGGDTTSTNPTITLPMRRPYTVTACFGTLAISSQASRPSGVMGADYSDTLRAGCGSVGSWAVTGGALPPGMALSAAGVLSGFPRQTGTFSFEATVSFGAQTDKKTFTLIVTAPALVTADVVAQLLGPATPLNADQVRYLDILGNGNGQFDIGDFLAWVKATGAPLNAALMTAIVGKGGRR